MGAYTSSIIASVGRHLMSERFLNCVFDGDMSALPALLYQ